MHPLALEDVLNGNPHTRSKADYYSRHLFFRVLCHVLAAEDASRPAGTHTQIPEVVTSDISDYEDKSKYANLVPNTDLKFPETPILPTYSPEPRTPKRVDRLRKLLMKQKAVLQSISSDFCSLVIFFFPFGFLQIRAQQRQRKLNEISLKAITKVSDVSFSKSWSYSPFVGRKGRSRFVDDEFIPPPGW